MGSKYSPPPSESDPSESPTLSEKSTHAVKRKRSNIFSKLRKSILSIGGGGGEPREKETERGSLKRALSMDAGLQNRISRLASQDENPVELRRSASKSQKRIQRSKSLINSSSTNVNTSERNSGIGSCATSPKLENDSVIYECEDGSFTTLSLLNTIETSHLPLSHQVFNCSWLAPTRKSHLFPGHLTLLPASSSIQFTCQHLTRSIKLKFLFEDILNISQGSWNDKRNQALIIDLIRGKRKTWVFVAWEEAQFQNALEILVQAWRKHCINRIKSRLDRRRAYFSIKYCRVIKEADRANEAVKFNRLIRQDCFKMLKSLFIAEDVPLIKSIKSLQPLTLKNVLFEKDLIGLVPEALASILTDQSTNFMTNFRALQGITITNDTGWHRNQRNFVSFVSKGPAEDSSKVFKWKVEQKFAIETTDFIVLRTTLLTFDTPDQVLEIIYEIASIPNPTTIQENSRVNIKISAELNDSGKENRSEEILVHFRENYFPILFHLLDALIQESQNQEESITRIESTDSALLVKLDLFLTVIILPFLYKLVHFKEFKFFRRFTIGLILLAATRISLICLLNYFFKTTNTPLSSEDIEEDFGALLKGLSDEGCCSVPIHELKLKYSYNN